MMACALPGNSCSISASASSSRASLLLSKYQSKKRQYCFKVRASSDEADDCNTEECAPDKEVGKVSVEWLAGEKTRVVGTFPPSNKSWTGYVEKDTAGQTNIYSVEPAVYIAESAISSGTAGSSAEGSGNTVAVVASIALISIAAASAVLLQVGKNPAVVQTTTEYSGPSLRYYINKFKPTGYTAPPPVAEGTPPPPQQTETSAQVEFQQDTSPLGSSIS